MRNGQLKNIESEQISSVFINKPYWLHLISINMCAAVYIY